MNKHFIFSLILPVLLHGTFVFSQSSIYVDYSKKGATIAPSMYGIFFEEINHSGDGSLYAELIQNRGFEEHVLPSGTTLRDGKAWAPSKPAYDTGTNKNFSVSWDTEALKFTAWTKTQNACDAAWEIVDESPLHIHTPHSLKVEISNRQTGGRVILENAGYWGIPLRREETYQLRFYLRSADYDGKVTAKVLQGASVFIEKTFDVDASGEWKEYTAELTSTGTGNTGVFQLEFDAEGTVYVDYVSLFPKNTFKGRANGMRNDVVQILAGLKPAFMRWPGGCIVEGLTIENRVKWKETLGDPMTRRGEWNRWGYRSTYGFGYHEFLQFCEDVGADAMFVANVGLACAFNNGDYVSREELPAFIQDIRDAIEYATGDASSEWGAKRIAAGHPEPFPLKYVELGNEQWGAFYPPVHDIFYSALKADYPEITFISTLEVGLDTYSMEKADMIDPHFYKNMDWFYSNSYYWDKLKRQDYKIYVGEYACNEDVGSGHIGAALSEAAYMAGMERNSDMITMTSYAPLIENNNRRDWKTNMIWVKNENVLGRSSYYVQKMYAGNRPDYNLPTTLVLNNMQPAVQGRVGLGTWATQAEFKDFRITRNDGSAVFYDADFVNRRTDWTLFAGAWSVTSEGAYRQSDTGTRRIAMMDKWMYNDCTIEVKAKKTGGSEGFLIVLGVPETNLNSHYQINIGGWNNAQTAIEQVTNGTGSIISEPAPFAVTNNRWYDIKIVVNGGNQMECYIDGEYIVGAAVNPTGNLQAIAGYDEAKGETVVKVVNGTAQSQAMNIVLNSKTVEATGRIITLSAGSLTAENSFAYPAAIVPVETEYSGFAKEFAYTFPKYSFTILRIRSDKDAEPEATVPQWYSDRPLPINGSGEWTALEETNKTGQPLIEDITVFDINGNVVYRKNNIHSPVYDIYLKHLSAGVYLVEALTEQGEHFTEKTIIK
jgi:alpha-L-arabinofuranosidase